jgi:putative addiction module CopG family antidote
MTIAIPSEFDEFVRERASAGRFSSVEEYVSSLLEADRRQAARERLAAELRLGFESGPAEPMTAAEWDELRDEVRQRSSSTARS